jgi:hypothetical protein
MSIFLKLGVLQELPPPALLCAAIYPGIPCCLNPDFPDFGNTLIVMTCILSES